MCGILAFFSKIHNSNISIQDFITYLKKLKNRGQDNLGISFTFNNQLTILNEKNSELLNQKITEINDKIEIQKFPILLGHTKYTTSGGKNNNINMPHYSKNELGEYALIFNGNVPLNNEEKSKYINDTQMIIDFINKESNSKNINSIEEVLIKLIETHERAFSMIVLFNNQLYILRDKYGVRPLYYYENENLFLFSSETSVLNEFKKNMGSGTINCINSGTINEINCIHSGTLSKIENNKLKVIHDYPNLFEKHCIFEYIYFMNKESEFENKLVKKYREEIGRLIAKNDHGIFNKQEYIVCGVPNTGNDYAIPYSEEINIPYKNYVIKNNIVNRTFILKNDEERNKFANVKYLFDTNLKNKKIILIDDSIVRGITLKNLIKNLREFGVKEIHIRSGSPPIIDICNWGIDIPTKEELVYNNNENLKDYFNCDSLKYISLEQIKSVFNDCSNKCHECLGNNVNLEW